MGSIFTISGDRGRRGVAFHVLVALALVGGPATAAPASVPGDACWTAVNESRAESTERWTAGDEAGALTTWIEVLRQGMQCSEGTMEQQNAVVNTFESVLVAVIIDGATLDEASAEVVHGWHQRFTTRGRKGEISPDFAEMYREFAKRMPPRPPPEPPVPPGPVEPGPPPRNGKAMRIGGAVVLTTGLGAVVMGVISTSATMKAQGELNQKCSLTCDTAAVAPIVARGQLHETLAPAFLAAGITATVVGSVLLAVGVRRKSSSMAMTPVLYPRFAGVSWALRF